MKPPPHLFTAHLTLQHSNSEPAVKHFPTPASKILAHSNSCAPFDSFCNSIFHHLLKQHHPAQLAKMVYRFQLKPSPLQLLTGLIERHGGAVVPSADASTTHIVVDPRSNALASPLLASEFLSRLSHNTVVTDSWLTESFRRKTRQPESAHSPVPPPPPPLPEAPAARRPLPQEDSGEEDAGNRDAAGGRISSSASFVVYDAFGEGASSSPGRHRGEKKGSRVLVVTWNCRGLANAKAKGGDGLLAGWLPEAVKVRSSTF